jgi:SAM-dependent methyltransferase
VTDIRDALVSGLRTVGAILSRTIDRGPFAGAWQRFRWAQKYRLGLGRHVPDLVTLLARPHRPHLVAAIDALGPWASVVEVGCGRGPNLVLLRRRNPTARIIGIDSSRITIERARRELVGYGVIADLYVARADDLRALGDGSVDVALADAVTMYLPPAVLESAIDELCRVARVGVVISTWTAESTPNSPPWRYDEGTWIYDYHRLVSGRPALTCAAVAYPAGVWADERWIRYGSVVTIRRARPGPST